MKRKVLFICGGGFLPRKDGNGNAVLTFGIVNVLLKLGFEVTITPVSVRCPREKLEADKKFLYENLGVEVVEFEGLIKPKSNSLKKMTTWLRLFFKNKDLDFFYSKGEATELLQYASVSDFTHIYGYDWDTVSVLALFDGRFKKIVSLVDLIDVFFDSKRKKLFKKISLNTPLHVLSWMLGKNKANLGYQYLQACDIIVEHASQHADQLRQRGFKNVHYIPHPILSKSIKDKVPHESRKVIISLIGSLKGVSSQLGFYFFLNDLYPQVIERIAEFKYDFEFRIIGYGKLPSDLDYKLKNLKYVNFMGFAEDVELQYHEADIILVTIPVSHGFRTRIAEAFSYRKCVIAHSANAEGMPEVEHGVNALISNSACDLASMIVQAVNSFQLRDEISSAAINTFNSKISVDVALHRYKSFLYENHTNGIQ